MRPVCSTLALVVLAASSAAAQTPLAAPADARGAPGGAVVATLRAGATVSAGAQRGAEVLVTIEGWVSTSLLGARRDTFPASAGAKSMLRVRATPSPEGTILADLKPGTGVKTLEKQGTWTHVRRAVWIAAGALPKTAAKAPAGVPESKRADPKSPAQVAAGKPAGPKSPAPPVAAPPDPVPEAPVQAPAGSMAARSATKVLASPGGRPLGDLAPGAIVEPLARDRGWMRVRVEGWVNERDLAPADSAFGAGLSAADLRADPEGTRGKIVRWEVQVLSLQTADPLRREMTHDEPYLLAKGPAGENALLYLAVPPSLLNEAKSIPPLTMVIITARVRTGRSEPVGTPILDLRTIAKK